VIDFDLLYGHPLSQPCALWERCDSHCCTMGRRFLRFDPQTPLVALPIPAPEYAYLRGLAPGGAQWPEAPRAIELELRGYSLRLYMQPCNFGGACEGALRPAICRLYPYVPLIDDDLRLGGLIHASALDLVWEPGADDDPCLMRRAEETRRYVELMRDLIGKLARAPENLELLLWFNLAYRYLEAFRDYLGENLAEGAAGEGSEEQTHILHLCNRTQLFLADPEFRGRLDAEVERMQRWRS